MKRKRPSNQRLTSTRDRRKQYFVEGVVKRGTNESWNAFCRWTWRVVKVLLVAAIAGGAWFGVTQGWKKLFWQNPDYSLSDIRFTTDGTLTRDQACTAAKLKTGANIFSYKTSAVRDALRALPQVANAEVVRYLPNRIEITVQERKPTAWLKAAADKKEPAHLLDASGLVFQPKHIPHEFRTLPVIAGVETEDLEPGKPVRKAEVVAALDLLRRTREGGSLRIQAMDVSRAYCIVATDQKGAQLTFGLDDIAGQIERLGLVRGEAALIGQEIATINLIPLRNIPVTFTQPPPPESEDGIEPIPAARPVTSKGKTTSEPHSSKDKTKPAVKPTKDAPKRDDDTGILKRFRAA